MSLVSVSTLKAYLPELTGTSADTELGNLLNRVEADIARYIGFPIYDSGTTPVLPKQTYTVYLDGPQFDDPSVLQLPFKPLVSITSIHSDADRVYGSATEITSSEYDLDLANARVILKTNVATEGFQTAFRAIKVVCVAGFDTNFPLDLEHAICVFASQLHRNKIEQGKESTGQRGGNVRFSPKTLPFEVKEILYPFRSSAMIL